MKKTHTQFVAEMKKINSGIEIIEQYTGSHTPISVRCKKCGYIWKAAPTNLLRNRNCPKCSYKKRGMNKRKTADEFYKELQIVNPDIEILDSYTVSTKKIKVRCKICSHEWSVMPSALLHGSGCPRCSHTGTSFAEQVIFLALQKMCPFKVLSRNRDVIGMELDIYIPELKFAIEYGAWPWHKDKVNKDAKKMELCREKGIKLIEIFDAYDGKEPDNDNVWVYRENIGKKENYNIIKEILKRICDTIQIPFTLTEYDFNEIQKQARNNARTLTTEQLNQILLEGGSDVFVIGEYKDALSKVVAFCKKCGYKWEVIPASLLRGCGCPVCSNKKRSEKQRKTTEKFIEELHLKNPNIEVLGEYESNNKKIEVKCIKHNLIWASTPKSLLRGCGCPQCNKEKISNKQRKSPELFLKEVYTKNPNIELLQPYESQKIKLKARCKICSTEFTTWPEVLLRGGGCPVCARRSQSKKRRKTDEDFRNELRNVNPSIEALGVYSTSKEKIPVKCGICGFEWTAIPSSLLKGYGCPNCKGNKKKTHDVFVKEMTQLKPMIEIKDRYVNAKTKIMVSCKKCGYSWMSSPTNLLSRDKITKCKQCGICFDNKKEK